MIMYFLLPVYNLKKWYACKAEIHGLYWIRPPPPQKPQTLQCYVNTITFTKTHNLRIYEHCSNCIFHLDLAPCFSQWIEQRQPQEMRIIEVS